MNRLILIKKTSYKLCHTYIFQCIQTMSLGLILIAILCIFSCINLLVIIKKNKNRHNILFFYIVNALQTWFTTQCLDVLHKNFPNLQINGI